MSIRFFLGPICTVLALSSCGKKSANVVDADFIGEWAYSCIEISTGDLSEFQSRVVEFKTKNFSDKISIYAKDDSSCSTKVETREINGSYTAGEGTDVVDINLVYDDVKMTAFDESTVSSLNEVGGEVCGGNWQEGKSKTLTKADCEGNSLNLPYSSLNIYDIYKIDGSNLYFGSHDDGLPTTEKNRPTIIDENLSYKRE